MVKSRFLGKYCRISPLVFSVVPRSHDAYRMPIQIWSMKLTTIGLYLNPQHTAIQFSATEASVGWMESIRNERVGSRTAGQAGRESFNSTHRRPSSKRRRGGALPAPFCCPSPQVMEFDFDLCGGIYPYWAQDIKELMRTRRAGVFPALALCIRRLYVTSRHTQMTGIADLAL